jgi:RNA recognition motif-containing protein
MVKKLYCGNMSYDTTEDALRALFAGVGEVESVNVITDRRSGRSKGFGFVEMATEEEAQAAISQLNGTTLDGRQISVAEARPQRPRSDRGDRGGGRRRGGGKSWDY